jgi:hypothetical protein
LTFGAAQAFMPCGVCIPLPDPPSRPRRDVASAGAAVAAATHSLLTQEFSVTHPNIRQWLTPAGFAAAVPDLAEFPLPAVSHALAMLRGTAVPVLDAPHAEGGPDTVYVVTPSHVLLVDAVRDDDPHGGRYVRLPAPLGGSAVGVPVPVVDVDTLQARLRGGVANCYLFPPGNFQPGDAAHHEGSAHRAIGALAGTAAMARAALAADPSQDLTMILPALGHALEDLSAVADGLTPYCGDFADHAEARLATITALLADGAAMAHRAHSDVTARLDRDHTLADLRLTEVLLRPEPDNRNTDGDIDAWVWHATGHLTDTRTGPGACHATIVTTQPHPSTGAAIDAVREVARRFGASRPDPGTPATLLQLWTQQHPPLAAWAEEMAAHAARLCLRLPATLPATEAAAGEDTAPPACPG